MEFSSGNVKDQEGACLRTSAGRIYGRGGPRDELEGTGGIRMHALAPGGTDPVAVSNRDQKGKVTCVGTTRQFRGEDAQLC